MSLEIWLGPQSIGQSSGVPRGIALPDGTTVIFATGGNSTQRHYTVIDILGNIVTSGRITLTEDLEMEILGAALRPDGGYDLLFGSGFQSIPTLYLVQLDANFAQVAPVQTVATQFNGFGEMRALDNGELAIVYGTFQSGIQNAGLRLVGADGTIGPQITANTNANPGPLFLQVAASSERIFTAWLDTAAQTVRGRIFDLDGNPIGAEFSIASSGTGDNTVEVEALPDGSFIVVWTRLENNDSTGASTVLGRHFGADGAPIGGQFVLNGATSGGQSVTGLEANANGEFIVTFLTQSGTLIRQFEADGTPVTVALSLPGVGSNAAIVPIGDGRYVVAGGGTSGNVLVVDGRMGIFDGDENDNLLVASNTGPSTVNGFGGNDRFFGGSQDDTFNGGAGNDQFTPGTGNNTLIGGAGDDTYFLNQVEFNGGTDTIVELAGEGVDTVHTRGGITLPDNVENVVIYASSNLIAEVIGNASANRMTGNDFGNVFSGLGGNDSLFGFGGNDTLRGGDGNDLLDGGQERDILEGGAGNDTLLGGAGDDTLTPGIGTDRIEAGSGNDEIRFSSANEASSGDFIDGGEGFDYIVLDSAISAFNLSLISTLSLEGLAHFGNGITVTLGAAQFNSLREIVHNGQAEFRISDAGTVIIAGINAPSGLGLVRLSNSGNTVDARAINAFQISIEGGAGDDIFLLGAGSDIATGGDGSDSFTGGAGDDQFDGGSNIDTAVVRGNRSAYTITQTATGVFEVTGPDGTDTLTAIEYLQFDDQTMRLLPGTGMAVNFDTADPLVYQTAMNNIRDFDGNALGGDGGWLRIGSADVDGDGDADQILVNRTIGRFATVGGTDDGLSYFDDFGWAGETRVVGIYIDPLVANGQVVAGSANDSQRRFQNDLQIENINRVLGADDYDGDGLQEVYFALTDGTAYLHAYMHADGNIQYANYQSQQQVIDFLTANGFDPSTWADWFPSGQEVADDKQEDDPDALIAGLLDDMAGFGGEMLPLRLDQEHSVRLHATHRSELAFWQVDEVFA